LVEASAGPPRNARDLQPHSLAKGWLARVQDKCPGSPPSLSAMVGRFGRYSGRGFRARAVSTVGDHLSFLTRPGVRARSPVISATKNLGPLTMCTQLVQLLPHTAPSSLREGPPSSESRPSFAQACALTLERHNLCDADRSSPSQRAAMRKLQA